MSLCRMSLDNEFRATLNQLNWATQKRKQQGNKDLCSDDVRTATQQSLKENSLTLSGWTTAVCPLRPFFALVFSFNLEISSHHSLSGHCWLVLISWPWMTSHLVVWTNHLHVPNGASAAGGHCTRISWGICDYSHVIILQLFPGPDSVLRDICLSPESALHRTPCYCCSWGNNTAVFVFLKHRFPDHLLHQVVCCVCVWVLLNNTHLVRGGARD